MRPVKNIRYCKKCGYLGPHGVTHEVSGGQWAMMVVLLCAFIIPGVIYGIHLATGGGAKGFYTCGKCGALRMSIPPDSPIAQAERAKHGIV